MDTAAFFRKKLSNLKFTGTESLAELDNIFVEMLHAIDNGVNQRPPWDEKPMFKKWIEGNRKWEQYDPWGEDNNEINFDACKSSALDYLLMTHLTHQLYKGTVFYLRECGQLCRPLYRLSDQFRFSNNSDWCSGFIIDQA